MLKANTRWDLKSIDKEKVNNIANELQITPLVASLLVNRGFDTIEAAETFLYSKQQDFHDPMLLDDMDKSVQRIHSAINHQEKILIFGDYDADGVSSTTIMLLTLKELGAEVDFYIPNRFTEGYGPNEEAFKWAKSNEFSLIITVDTGISALNEARIAKELEIDLIITDHHEPGPELPEAYSIIHPKKPSCPYPFKDLAGVGVAFKLAHALYGKVPESLLEIAAIGTIADLVPLQGENRLIASKGINRLKITERPGIKALLKICSVEPSKVSEETIGFAIGPRINAVGRLQSADPAVQLLITNDQEEANELAQEIDLLNKERQKLVNEMTEEAIKEVDDNYPLEENSVLVIAREGWNAGVIGIVASRLVDRYYRPTIVLSIDANEELAKGSARSIVGFDLYENLATCRELLPHFGGHPMAAGMTLKVEHIDELRERLNRLANEKLTDEDFIPVTAVDVKSSIEELTLEAIEQLEQLAPFGMNNPKPRVLIENVSLQSIRKIGSDQTHLKAVFEKDEFSLDSVGFGFGHLYDEISPLAQVSVIGEVSINEWNNFRKPQLMLQDLKVDDWQLFDVRGNRDIIKVIEAIPQEKRKLIVFNKDNIEKLKLESYREFVHNIASEEAAKQMNVQSDYLLFVDLPTSKEIVETLLSPALPDRIYTFFHHEQDHFFSTIPTREHFKWFYSFLAKKGAFDVKKYSADLAKYRGWSKKTIDFMSQVFFELEFVKIDKGIITLSNHAHKRDLVESKTYRRKQEQLELENDFIYSSYQHLKHWFDKVRKIDEPSVLELSTSDS